MIRPESLCQESSQPSQSYPHDDRFTSQTRNIAGHKAEILDAYVYGSWHIGNMPLNARFGRQVFNWGEGIFYRGGVNTTNPVDAAKYRLPGSELKEVLMPVDNRLRLSAAGLRCIGG